MQRHIWCKHRTHGVQGPLGCKLWDTKGAMYVDVLMNGCFKALTKDPVFEKIQACEGEKITVSLMRMVSEYL